ncbi:MAG: VCBS repeat-containing protein [Saprospiraceae bacterium]|nr:VCBS repeat-containing protein [Saprospiraceae bacterium]
MKVLIFILTYFSLNILNAQNIQRWNIDFIENGKLLKYPTAGGLNSPQFNEADLNHDGIQDLVVFDRAGDLLRTFINHGSPNKIDYTFEPQYIDNFPTNLKFWFLLKDYNKDGAADIFAYSDIPGISGIIVYKGFYDNNQLKFKRVLLNQDTYNVLYFPTNDNKKGQVHVSSEDYPDINDIDNDGDLDIVTFASQGGYVYLYSNQSVESGFGSDTLLYKLTDYCWGKFYEKGENEYVSLSANNTDCSKGFTADTISRDGKHVGSTLLTLDMDNDGDKEIILGDISFPSIGMLTNGGTKDLAWMTAQEPFFPTKHVSAIVYTFPATFYLDVNNDQKKDLIVAPNAINASDDVDCNWLYLNSGITNKPVFKLNSKTFLNEEMVDWGSGAYMTFGDINADGLQDLLIGTEGSYLKNEGFRDIRMVYYKNIGTLSNPKFELADSNYLNIIGFKRVYFSCLPNIWGFR